MNVIPKLSLLAGALLAVLGQSAAAQSSFSIPNPIIKPSSYGAATQAANTQSPPPPIPRADAPLQFPTLPSAVGAASLPGQSSFGSAPGNDTVVRDTLATFTVTAIVGNRAVLRNNVGGIAMQAEGPVNRGAQSQGGGQGGGQGAQAPLPRQAVIRVKSEVPVYVAGVELTPTVLESRVEFRLAGKKAIVSTVTLESQSSYGYVPTTANREVYDPAVSARVSPAVSGADVRPSDPAGAVPASNGAAPTPH